MLNALKNIQVLLTLLCGVCLLSSFVHPWPGFPILSVIFGSYFALKSAWESLRDRSIDVNFLMVFAAIGAVSVGRPTDAAALLFLFSLSSTLEAYAMARTKSAIEGLIKLRPSEALLVAPDGERKVPVQDLQPGDTIRILAFENVPADGVIVEGDTAINQSAMTGESLPVEKRAGDNVLAGTENQGGMILVQVTAGHGQTTLEKIVELVRDAQENKASGERISAWFGQRYTFFVVGAFLVSLLARVIIKQPFNDALLSALTLLVALSPCALVISTPASTLSALAWAARNGLLVRGGEFIEHMGKIKIAAIDKTGTLTRGRPVLAEICVCSSVTVASGHGPVCREEESCWQGHGELSPDAAEMLRFAAAGEQYSSHPIAGAIVEAARQRGLDVPEAEEHHSLAGLGVSARVEGKVIRIGQRRMFEQEEQRLDPHFAEHVVELQRKGMTVAVMEVDGKLAALGLRDEPREDAHAFLEDMQRLGVDRVVMITGDTRETAASVAQELRIQEFHAQLMPDEKTEIISQLVGTHNAVMMIGDGINDAPSLAKATVGVAMGGLGSDIALNAADVVLMRDRLVMIPQLIRLGKMANGIIKSNLFFATSVIACLTISSLFFKLPLPLAVVGHEGSTVIVILNGLRLLRGPRPA